MSEQLYVCIAGGSPNESECVIVRGNSGIRSWVHQALFSGRWDEAPQDVRDLRESAVDPDEWEDDHWSARFEDGWLDIRPVTHIERNVSMGLHPIERDAVLAGLRLLQEKIADGADISDIADIYTDCGKHDGLSEFWIENLCQRINR